jgi:hypothetical protein
MRSDCWNDVAPSCPFIGKPSRYSHVAMVRAHVVSINGNLQTMCFQYLYSGQFSGREQGGYYKPLDSSSDQHISFHGYMDVHIGVGIGNKVNIYVRSGDLCHWIYGDLFHDGACLSNRVGRTKWRVEIVKISVLFGIALTCTECFYLIHVRMVCICWQVCFGRWESPAYFTYWIARSHGAIRERTNLGQFGSKSFRHCTC